MIAQVVNAVAVIIGSLIGLVFNKFFTEKMSTTINYGLALCVLYIGFSGLLSGCENVLYIIISIVIGAIIGELIDIDGKVNTLSEWLEKQFNKNGKKVSIAQGFLNATLLFCVGAMAIVGSLNAGILKDYSVIYAKSMIDGVSAIIFASTLGIGVMFSSVSLFLYQGLITLLSSLVAPLLLDVVINDMNLVGSLLLVAISFNMMKITKIKVANLVPAIFIPILIYLFI